MHLWAHYASVMCNKSLRICYVAHYASVSSWCLCYVQQVIITSHYASVMYKTNHACVYAGGSLCMCVCEVYDGCMCVCRCITHVSCRWCMCVCRCITHRAWWYTSIPHTHTHARIETDDTHLYRTHTGLSRIEADYKHSLRIMQVKHKHTHTNARCSSCRSYPHTYAQTPSQ